MTVCEGGSVVQLLDFQTKLLKGAVMPSIQRGPSFVVFTWEQATSALGRFGSYRCFGRRVASRSLLDLHLLCEPLAQTRRKGATIYARDIYAEIQRLGIQLLGHEERDRALDILRRQMRASCMAKSGYSITSEGSQSGEM